MRDRTRRFTLVVKGMSCEHCKVAITGEASQVSGVESVEVDLDTKLVHVRGTDVDETAVVSCNRRGRIRGGGGMSASTRHFARHYAEMLAAMFIGMGVLAPPLGAALGLVGLSSTTPPRRCLRHGRDDDRPDGRWMRYRGHGWPACADMTAAMFIPTLALSHCCGAG